MKIDVSAEIVVGERLIAFIDITFELDQRESLQRLRQIVLCLCLKVLLTVRAGALSIALGPFADATSAEEASTILAGLWLANDLGTHHADESIIEGLHRLIFLQLWVDSVKNLDGLIALGQIMPTLLDQALQLFLLLSR